LRSVPRHPPPPQMPVVRYERATPGELLHVDIKRLGRIDGIGHRITADPRDRCRGAGWECVHVCIDDHSRVAYADIRPDQADRPLTLTGYALGVITNRIPYDQRNLGTCSLTSSR